MKQQEHSKPKEYKGWKLSIGSYGILAEKKGEGSFTARSYQEARNKVDEVKDSVRPVSVGDQRQSTTVEVHNTYAAMEKAVEELRNARADKLPANEVNKLTEEFRRAKRVYEDALSKADQDKKSAAKWYKGAKDSIKPIPV